MLNTTRIDIQTFALSFRPLVPDVHAPLAAAWTNGSHKVLCRGSGHTCTDSQAAVCHIQQSLRRQKRQCAAGCFNDRGKSDSSSGVLPNPLFVVFYLPCLRKKVVSVKDRSRLGMKNLQVKFKTGTTVTQTTMRGRHKQACALAPNLQ